MKRSLHRDSFEKMKELTNEKCRNCFQIPTVSCTSDRSTTLDRFYNKLLAIYFTYYEDFLRGRES